MKQIIIVFLKISYNIDFFLIHPKDNNFLMGLNQNENKLFC